jgi:hypothetical protein
MWKWLYNSQGKPIAFAYREFVFSKRGRYLGILSKDQVWNGEYVGSIVNDDVLLYQIDHPTEVKDAPSPQSCPGVPSPPGDRRATGVQTGFRDVRV